MKSLSENCGGEGAVGVEAEMEVEVEMVEVEVEVEVEGEVEGEVVEVLWRLACSIITK